MGDVRIYIFDLISYSKETTPKAYMIGLLIGLRPLVNENGHDLEPGILEQY